jgi:hypothetical protein
VVDPWVAMQQFKNRKDMSLDERLVEALAPRAIKVFGHCGKMTVEGGSDHVSPQRYTIFTDPSGEVDPVKIAAGLKRVLADTELEEIYHTVLGETQQMFEEIRSMNQIFFSTRQYSTRKTRRH